MGEPIPALTTTLQVDMLRGGQHGLISRLRRARDAFRQARYMAWNGATQSASATDRISVSFSADARAGACRSRAVPRRGRPHRELPGPRDRIAISVLPVL